MYVYREPEVQPGRDVRIRSSKHWVCALLRTCEGSEIGVKMGYENFDHAGWMQSHIDSERKSRRRLPADLPEQLSDFQRRVVNIIGIVGGGIYNAPINVDKIDWRYGFNGISVIFQREMATWDFNQLTTLVFLCHEARIRCSLEGAGPRAVRLSFWARVATGDIAVRHPNLDEALANFRKAIGPEHPIIYRPTPAPPA